MAQAPHIPTDETRADVESYMSVGVNQEQTALLLNIDQKTLRKYYQRELDTGKLKANVKIGKTLFQKATEGDTASLIWWSKAQMGWSETKNINADVGIDAKVDGKWKVEFVNATPESK